MKVAIDGVVVSVGPEDKNIVDVADRAHIGISTLCCRDDRVNGCCKACVVEIDGEKKYACETKPVDGMNIIVDREDLKKNKRKKI